MNRTEARQGFKENFSAETDCLGAHIIDRNFYETSIEDGITVQKL